MNTTTCHRSPKGWRCFLPEGHEGPCPTVPEIGTYRYNAIQEAHIDHKTTLGWNWKWRLLIRFFPGAFYIFALHLTNHAYERGLISSQAMHELDAMADRMVRPKITPLNVPSGHQHGR